MDQTYIFLQQYWWVIIALLGGILVFLLFVQGGNSLLFEIGKNDAERKMMINSTGRKWEFTFTTLVTFGASFFASFPLFYSTSFGGAYWLWMIILFTFVLQAVSYEFQDRAGNLVGKKTYHIFLIINGILGPVLLGGAVATFFNGSNFIVDKGNILGLGGLESSSVISQWANASHGLDALLDPWNVALGLAVFFLARVLGILYFINSIDHEPLIKRCRKALIPNTAIFLVSFLAFVIRTLLKDGFAVNPDTQEIFMQSYKYFSNLIEMPIVAGVFLIGVVLVLYGILRTIFQSTYDKGIWFAGFGTGLAVSGLFLLAGFNNTAYYPSNVDIQYSLTIANSSSSKNTLKVMAYASLLMPFVFAYIFYAWRSLNKDKIDKDEIDTNKHMY